MTGKNSHSFDFVYDPNAEPWNEAERNLRIRGVRPSNLDQKRDGDDGDQRQHETLDHADAETREPQHQQRVEGGQQNADQQGNVK